MQRERGPESHLHRSIGWSHIQAWPCWVGREKMVRWIKRAFPDFFLALALTGAALIFFLLTFGTSYHQLAIGLLASAVAWVLLIILLESVWRLVTALLRYLGIEGDQTEWSGP